MYDAQTTQGTDATVSRCMFCGDRPATTTTIGEPACDTCAADCYRDAQRDSAVELLAFAIVGAQRAGLDAEGVISLAYQLVRLDGTADERAEQTGWPGALS